MPTVYTEVGVGVDVDLSDFDTDELIEELESRNGLPVESNGDTKEIVEAIWLKRRMGKDYQAELDTLIYCVLGKIV